MPKKRKANKRSPLLLFIGGGIVLLDRCAILLANQNATLQPPRPIGEDIPYPEIQRVSLADAKAALDSGSAVLLDVRSAEAFAGQRIAGSVNIPQAKSQPATKNLTRMRGSSPTAPDQPKNRAPVRRSS
jgi:3-mercaptopyruvate sulfurtransferase SseA